MKKIIVAVLVILLIILIIFGIFKIKNGSKIPFSTNEQLVGIIYLGGLEVDYDYFVVNKYYTESEKNKFEVIELGGEECYLIIPRYNIEITINKLSMNEDGGTNKTYIRTINKPVYIKCNESDIFSNLEINFKYQKKEYSYSPYISLKDGSVVVEDFICLVK